MSMPLPSAVDNAVPRTGKPGKPKIRTYVLLFAGWALLVGCGIWGAKQYTDRLKAQVAADIAAQTDRRLLVVQEDYQKQIGELKETVATEMNGLQAKVNTLNELLAFTKDSANSKTDNSNLLYTQLAEVKKKLDELQKNLDALK